jgi:hypothetical protein
VKVLKPRLGAAPKVTKSFVPSNCRALTDAACVETVDGPAFVDRLVAPAGVGADDDDGEAADEGVVRPRGCPALATGDGSVLGLADGFALGLTTGVEASAEGAAVGSGVGSGPGSTDGSTLGGGVALGSALGSAATTGTTTTSDAVRRTVCSATRSRVGIRRRFGLATHLPPE